MAHGIVQDIPPLPDPWACLTGRIRSSRGSMPSRTHVLANSTHLSRSKQASQAYPYWWRRCRMSMGVAAWLWKNWHRPRGLGRRHTGWQSTLLETVAVPYRQAIFIEGPLLRMRDGQMPAAEPASGGLFPTYITCSGRRLQAALCTTAGRDPSLLKMHHVGWWGFAGQKSTSRLAALRPLPRVAFDFWRVSSVSSIGGRYIVSIV